MNIITNEWQGHRGRINCLAKIEKPLGFITGSIDKHVRVWSLYGDMWVDLTIIGKDPIIKWEFPYDWNEVKEKDKNEVIAVMKQIEPGSDPELLKIQFEDEEPVKVGEVEKNKENPKVTLKWPLMVSKKGEKKNSQIEEASPALDEQKNWRMKLKGDKIELPRLAQDVTALVDIYNNSSAEKKKELLSSMDDLREKLRNFQYSRNR